MKIPPALKSELDQWNDKAGISVEEWIACVGNLDIAIGYSTVFWPEIELVGDYVLRAGHSMEAIRAVENQENATPLGVEKVLNHLHIVDMHLDAEVKPTVEHCQIIGSTLKEIYSAKLAWQFPDRPCEVELYVPENAEELTDYQISFWQKKWEES